MFDFGATFERGSVVKLASLAAIGADSATDFEQSGTMHDGDTEDRRDARGEDEPRRGGRWLLRRRNRPVLSAALLPEEGAAAKVSVSHLLPARPLHQRLSYGRLFGRLFPRNNCRK